MRKMPKTPALVISLIAVTALAACTQAPDETPPSVLEEPKATVAILERPSIVATTSILGSVAQQIATCVADQEGAESRHVRTLLPIGTDPHDFQPSSEQVAAMESADIVIANGLLLEEGLTTVFDRLQEAGANLWLTAEWIEALEFAGHSGDDHGHDDHGHDDHGHDDHGHGDHSDDVTDDAHAHGDNDPHFWFDMSKMAEVAVELGERLTDETGDTAWSECGVTVGASITNAEAEVIELFTTVDRDKRVIITDHDAFAYLAERYDFEIAGVVIPGGSTLSDATSAELARLVDAVDKRGIRALIGSIHSPSRLLDAIAEESGGSLQVVPLYVESVGEPGTPAADYQGMMIWNAQQIVKALQD
jgi:zinc/manganese transport system substrate-binding protein